MIRLTQNDLEARHKVQPGEPVYYQVRAVKSGAMRRDNSGPYDLMVLPAWMAQPWRSESLWGGDFNTRAEAVAFGESQGWVKVSTWREAYQLATPWLRAERQRREEAKLQADLRRITTPEGVAEACRNLVNNPVTGTKLVVWVGSDGELRMNKKTL